MPNNEKRPFDVTHQFAELMPNEDGSYTVELARFNCVSKNHVYYKAVPESVLRGLHSRTPILGGFKRSYVDEEGEVEPDAWVSATPMEEAVIQVDDIKTVTWNGYQVFVGRMKVLDTAGGREFNEMMASGEPAFGIGVRAVGTLQNNNPKEFTVHQILSFDIIQERRAQKKR